MYNRRPPYQFSQNFLTSNHTITRLIGLCKIAPETTVVEIGAGSGQLTKRLAGLVPLGRLIAIEADPAVFQLLRNNFHGHDRVELVLEDALAYNWKALPVRYCVVSNLPFSITSDLTRLILNPLDTHCSQAYLILQKEAALMLGGARTGGVESKKSLLIAPFYQFKILTHLSRYEFKPVPSVEAVYVEIIERGQWLVPRIHVELWQDFVTTIAHDRVGEGVWKTIFRDIRSADWNRYGLVVGKGIQSQTFPSCLRVFHSMVIGNGQTSRQITLRAQQLRIHASKIEKQHRTRDTSTFHRIR